MCFIQFLRVRHGFSNHEDNLLFKSPTIRRSLYIGQEVTNMTFSDIISGI